MKIFNRQLGFSLVFLVLDEMKDTTDRFGCMCDILARGTTDVETFTL